MAAVTCSVDGMLNDSPQSMTAFLRRLGPIFQGDIAGWHLDLSKCTYLGSDAAALLVACHLDATRRGLAATVDLPHGNAALDAFLRFSGVEHYLTGVALPAADPELIIPVRVQKNANYNDPDPIINLVARHLTLAPDTEEYLRICVNEVIQNVEDHARSAVGCVSCARFLKNIGEVRVAIVDCGRGIGTTLGERYGDVRDASDALGRVIAGGYSAKSRPNNMGVGISNLTNIIVQPVAGRVIHRFGRGLRRGPCGAPAVRPPAGRSVPWDGRFLYRPTRITSPTPIP